MPVPEKNKPSFSWGHQPPEQIENLAKFIIKVSVDVRKLCLAEPRCLHIRAPCYILGDLHGNYQDLIAFEKALWRIGPALSPANFLFLGDYVDRGENSVEVITYLLAQKLMCPNKFVLLRGNHETRLQNSFPGYSPCFKDSCTALFGEEIGGTVWESVNAVFDTLPLAAVIDNSIFCVHGGIPPQTLLSPNDFGHSCHSLVAELNRLPRDIPHPDPQQGGSALAWDLMWNDPAPSVTLPEGAVGPDGFGVNTSRGTGHMFTAEALDAFLKTYGFSHLVRAHEVRKQGFQVQQHARMITLFSSSGYCGAGNEACCILACEGKMRFIRLEHHHAPQKASLASRAAAAGAFAAAVAAGRQEEAEAKAASEEAAKHAAAA
eukprot:CAMPEP_0114152628 /NCGR_PEP_ID=MMETSP0043_2-20121206/23906_1 /TAXON_ID=464988 /ORGANISM="Hemiselmis andersenii, Strain CCMP644" /LENGTH=375 /DNA_ID=CAMNT_0001247575 /DNA_START=3 /DNA_END=1126 /DNA_ORIENTATION=-